MTHDDLLIEINRRLEVALYNGDPKSIHALRAVVELHKPDKEGLCAMNCVDVDDDGYSWTQVTYPCPTIQAIEKELK
jgi:hypothetical protein